MRLIPVFDEEPRRHCPTKRTHGVLSGLCVILLLAGSLVAQPRQAQAAGEDVPAPRPAVTITGKPLFFVQERVLSFSPKDRAAAISQRIKRIALNPLIKIDAGSTLESVPSGYRNSSCSLRSD